MGTGLDIQRHLADELAAPDPWRLDSNPFERRRYQALLDAIAPHGPFETALEVGCAAGAFTERLAPHCRRLEVMDVRPEAVARTRERLAGREGLAWRVADVAEPLPARAFDLIVAAEVLYYLPDPETLARAVANLAQALRPGGLLVLGSAVDAACRGWGLFGGAETAMRLLAAQLTEASRQACRGADAGEDCLVVAYRAPEAAIGQGAGGQGIGGQGMEGRLVAYQASVGIPAAGVLVIAPHPDDEVLGCGGAIIGHVERSVPVRVVVVTDGAFGREGPDRRRHTERRREESRQAARVLGYGTPEFWDLPDQGIACDEPMIAALQAAIGEADLVYAPSVFEIHPDHRALGLAAAEAVRRRGGVRLAQYEVGAPLRPNVLVDITAAQDRKHAALACFASQLAEQRYDRQVAALNLYRTYTLPPQVEAAEGFHLLDPAALANGPQALYRAEHEIQAAMGRVLAPAPEPLVSVIVRSLDRPTLGEALASVAAQSYRRVEVVLVDATGRHGPLPDTCGAFPLRRAGSGDALGRARAANLGLAAATGDLILFLDDDDLIGPDHLARLVAAIAEGQGARAANAGVEVVGPAGRIDCYDAPIASPMLKASNQSPIHAVLFARSLVEEGCRFDESLEVYEDWDFWLQVAERTAFAHCPGVSATYRAHLGGSGLSGPGSEARQQAGRDRVLEKWSPVWGGEGVIEMAGRLKTTAQRLAHAEFTVGELERLLEAERREVARRDEIIGVRDHDLVEHIHALAEMRRTLAAIQASHFWRATGPLRRIVDWTRRLRRPTQSA